MSEKPTYEELEEKVQHLEQEISKSKRVEEELYKSKQLIEVILNAIPVRVYWKDQHLVYLGCNTLFANDAGLADPNDLIGKDDYQMGWRNQAELYRHGDWEVIESGEPKLLIEETRTTPAGNTVTLLTSKIPLRSFMGEISGVLGTYLDITDRKQVEKEFARLFSMSLNMICIADINTAKFLKVNPAFTEILGYSEKDLLEKPFFEFIHPDDLDSTRSVVEEKLLQGTKVMNFENRYRCKDGSYRWLSWVSQPDPDQGITYAIAHDLTNRKKSEDALKASEVKLRAVLDATPFPVAVVDLHDDRILFWSRSALELFGHTAPTASEWYQIAYPDPGYRQAVIERWKPFLDEASKSQRPVNTGEYRITCRDGSVKNCELYATFLPDNLIVTFRDITEHREAQTAQKESEARYQSLLHNIQAAVVVHGADTQIEVCNPKAEELLGLSQDQLLGRKAIDSDWHFLNANGDRMSLEQYPINQVLSRRQALRDLTLGIHQADKAGIGWVLVNADPVFDDDGEISQVIITFMDITKSKRAEEELSKAQNYITNIIDSMPSVLIGVDSKGKVTQWNREAQRATGLGPEAAGGRPLEQAFPPLAAKMERISEAIGTRQVRTTPRQARKADGHTRYENVTIFPLMANGVEGAVIRVDDVTEQVRLEEMMIQSEKMLSVGGLAAGMAHEINNPLAGILQNAAVMANRLTSELPANHKAAATAGTTMAVIQEYLELRKLPEMLESIRTSGTMAAAIVKNMLSFARKSERKVSSHNLGYLLDQALDLLKTDYDMKRHYDFKQIDIQREYDDGADPVSCEASKLQQVFMNILKNGAEAMAGKQDAPTPPAFILRIQDDGSHVRVEIEDNGPGMDEETRRRVFEPFFTTKPTGKGTGLGLSVSYFIVAEDHGGEMGVHSTEGGGTRFVIRLPKSVKSVGA